MLLQYGMNDDNENESIPKSKWIRYRLHQRLDSRNDILLFRVKVVKDQNETVIQFFRGNHNNKHKKKFG